MYTHAHIYSSSFICLTSVTKQAFVPCSSVEEWVPPLWSTPSSCRPATWALLHRTLELSLCALCNPNQIFKFPAGEWLVFQIVAGVFKLPSVCGFKFFYNNQRNYHLQLVFLVPHQHCQSLFQSWAKGNKELLPFPFSPSWLSSLI